MAGTTVTVASWNVNSVARRVPGIVRWLRQASPTLLCLQELKCATEKFPREEMEAEGYEHVYVHGQKSYNGVAFLSRVPMEDVRLGFSPVAPSVVISAPKVKEEVNEDGKKKKRRSKKPLMSAYDESRVISGRLTGSDIRVVNIYGPNGQNVGSERYMEKLEWYREFREWLRREFSEDKLIVCGDMNVAPSDEDIFMPDLYRDGKHIACTQLEREELEELVATLQLTDTHRLYLKGEGHFSFWGHKGMAWRNNAGWRLDQIYANGLLASHCTNAWIDSDVRGWDQPSDHVPIVSDFNIPPS